MRESVTNGQTIPDSPTWILRHHAPSAIHYLRVIKSDQIGRGGLLVATGDSDGRFSLTSLSDYRQRYFWKAHSESILGVDVQRVGAENVLISSGRDNHLHIFELLSSRHLTSAVLPSRIQSELPVPKCLYTLDINSLNYCAFSALPVTDTPAGGMLVAVPHTVDSGYIDIFHFPSKARVSTAIGKADLSTKSTKASRAAIVMSLQMIKVKGQDAVRIIAGYEDGYVKVWKVEKSSALLEWSERQHSESIMAIAVSTDESFVVSVAADRKVVRYEMDQTAEPKSIISNSAGHACVAIRGDGQVIAVGGWDGCIRLYNARLEQLGSLRYHRDTVQALSFVQVRDLSARKIPEDDDDDDFYSESDEEDGDRGSGGYNGSSVNLLVSGGKEGRVCLWKT